MLSENQLSCYHILLETFEDKIKPRECQISNEELNKRSPCNRKTKQELSRIHLHLCKIVKYAPPNIRSQEKIEPFKSEIKSWISNFHSGALSVTKNALHQVIWTDMKEPTLVVNFLAAPSVATNSQDYMS